MKRILLFLLMALLPCCALAGGADAQPKMTPAVTASLPEALETVPPERIEYPCTAVAAARYYGETVPLYAQASGDSAVLMNYYRGTRVTVLREALPGYLLVQCGTPEASLMGYMKKDDLAFGSAALREIQPEFVKLKFNREATVFRYCDALSGEIDVCTTEGEYYTIGKNDDKWVQLYAPVGMTVAATDDNLPWVVHEGDGEPFGFVQLETGMARGYEAKAWRWETEPLPGEITRRQAIELAIWWMMNAEGEIPDALRDEQALRLLPFETEWECSPPGVGYIELSVVVTYECDAYSITVGLYPNGEIRYGRYEEAAEGS